MEKQLPKNWVETDLENLFNLVYGKGLSVSELLEDGYDVYGANGIIGKYDKFTYEKSKVIISCRGAASGAMHKTNPKSYITSNSIVLDEVSDKLLNLDFVKYSMIIADKSDVITGTAQPQITIQLLKYLKFRLPPLPEQNRIVTKLDTLFAQLETIKTSMANIPLLLKDFRQQVLTQAVTGKLTEEWRKGTKLGAVKLITKIHPIEYSILDFSKVPSNWTITALGNFAICSRGKFTPRPRNDPKYFDGIYPFMQIGDLPREGGLTSSYSKTLNELGKKVSKSFEKDTVVIAIVGATIGNTGILNEKMYFPDSLIGIDSSNEKSNIYIEYFLRVCKYSLREISYSSGGQPNINTQVIKNLGIAIAPFEEQQEIVSRVESLFAKADAIEQQYKTLKACIDNVPQAILHKAFKGELTEQLDSDGDAWELLQQIQELKNSAVKPKKATA